MYRDTEQSYGNWTLDVYQSVHTGEWCVDYWHRFDLTHERGHVTGRRRKEVVAAAEKAIDAAERLSTAARGPGR